MIHCDQHDYIEIACLYRFPIALTLRSGDIVQGKAITTAYDELKCECVDLQTEETKQRVRLEEVVSMKALVANPHFEEIVFLH